ncbi:hypothetical protein AB0F43_31845 [Kribbella sp. NPDC023972]|uniref:hypothetical protein n=1 Tax=Kribbella sp. NPDC023972 TaxID=3154795 RepID=UPI0033EDEA0B
MQVNSAHPRTAPAALPHESLDAVHSSTTSAPEVRVRTWLGDHLITDFTAPVEAAPRHITAVSQLLSRLRLTVEAVGTHSAGDR